MACLSYLLKGISYDCSPNLAGIKQIKLTYRDNVDVQVDFSAYTATVILTSGEWYEYSFGRNSASMTSSMVKDEPSETKYYNYTIEMSFNKLSPEKNLELDALATEKLVAIVVDNNNQSWFLGYDGYLNASVEELTTGSGYGDRNGYKVTLNGSSKYYPFAYTEGEKPITDQYLTLRLDGLESGWSAVEIYTTSGKTIQYRRNKGEWSSTSQGYVVVNNLIPGDIIEFRGNNDSYEGCTIKSYQGNYSVYGNIMSLIYGDNFMGATSFPSGSTYNFKGLFNGATIEDASQLILPATTMTQGCYQEMFKNNYLLSEAPELPATTVTQSCYEGMFDGCSSLQIAPELIGSNTANWCYKRMFADCTGLTQVPELTATAISIGSYYEMFAGCASLTDAPDLPATFVNTVGYYQMFYYCTSLTGAPVISCTTLGTDSFSDEEGGTNLCGMFQGCTSLVQAPELLITGVTKTCCTHMFKNCTNLKYAMSKLLPETLDGTSCFSHMFEDCPNLETTPEIMATGFTQDVNYVLAYLFANDSKVNYIKTHFIPNGYWGCGDWVKGVAATGTFECPSPGTSERGKDWIPEGWTMITF